MSAVPASSTPALGRFYQDHQSWLRAWFSRRLHCNDTACDLVQDTFVRVLLRPQAAIGLRTPRAYLTTIAHGLLIDHWRRRSLEQAYLEALAAVPISHAPSPEEQVVMLRCLDEVDRMLAELAPKARQAFVLAQFGGLGYADIASQLGVTERTVKRYVAHGFECCLLAMA